jgi:hypothetical protein
MRAAHCAPCVPRLPAWSPQGAPAAMDGMHLREGRGSGGASSLEREKREVGRVWSPWGGFGRQGIRLCPLHSLVARSEFGGRRLRDVLLGPSAFICKQYREVIQTRGPPSTRRLQAKFECRACCAANDRGGERAVSVRPSQLQTQPQARCDCRVGRAPGQSSFSYSASIKVCGVSQGVARAAPTAAHPENARAPLCIQRRMRRRAGLLKLKKLAVCVWGVSRRPRRPDRCRSPHDRGSPARPRSPVYTQWRRCRKCGVRCERSVRCGCSREKPAQVRVRAKSPRESQNTHGMRPGRAGTRVPSPLPSFDKPRKSRASPKKRQ